LKTTNDEKFSSLFENDKQESKKMKAMTVTIKEKTEKRYKPFHQ